MLIGIRVSSGKFNYQADLKIFATEISTVGFGFVFGRLYDDAMDLGFVMVSTKTGKEVPFYFLEADTDEEGDVAGWRFKSVDGEFHALIIND